MQVQVHNNSFRCQQREDTHNNIRIVHMEYLQRMYVTFITR